MEQVFDFYLFFLSNISFLIANVLILNDHYLMINRSLNV